MDNNGSSMPADNLALMAAIYHRRPHDDPLRYTSSEVYKQVVNTAKSRSSILTYPLTMDSKSLPPRTESFFPTIFYKTQFCER